MEQLARYAIMTELIKTLRTNDSWCGETHIQKTAYFLQELLRVPTEFEFILYMHGPFSFDLRDELAAMLAYNLLEFKSQQLPYGPRWNTLPNAENMRNNYSVTLAKYCQQINFVATRLGPKRVGELEKLATALYLVINYSRDNADNEQLAEEMHRLKPHVTVEDARTALIEFNNLQNEAITIAVA